MKKIFTLLFALLAIVQLGKVNAKSSAVPPAQFNASTYNGCAPLTVTFYNTSAGNGSYSWNFGDPTSGVYNSSIACSPTHTFVNAGSYTVTMTYVLGPNTYTTTAVITVWPRPVPVISGNDTVCEGTTGTYTVAGFAGSSFYWTINGGSIMGSNTGTSVVVNWNVPGTGILTVKETTNKGCINTGKLKVLVANQPQIGNFCDISRGTSGGNEPDKEKRSCLCMFNINTINAIDINGQLMSNQMFNFQWTVISGGSIISGGNTNAAQVYVGAGPTITLQLIAYNDFGCADTQICIFDVCPSPTASFKADTACLTGTTHFNASASTVAGQIVNYYWQFGDLSQANTASPYITHVYATAGIKIVKLRVKYASGCTDDTIIKVLVNNGTPPPIDCPGTVCHNTQHCYSTPYYSGAIYQWTVTGGIGTPNANGDSICVVWGAGPQGNISLNVTGGPYTCGYNSVDIPVFPANLQISGPDTVCQGSTVQFSVPLIPGSCYSWMPSSPNINLANNPGNIISVTIPPNALGTYTIYADVRNDITCCSGKDSHTFVIQGSIKIDTVQSTCEFSTVTYTSNVAVNWTVTGGTIQSSSPTSVTINWGGSGTGTIYATAISPNLVCVNSIAVQINLVPLPPNPPINGPTIVCVGTVATYSYVNSPNIAGSTWTISPSAAHTPSGNSDVVTFTTPGTYTISTNYFNQQYNNSWQFKCFSQSTLKVLVVDTACPTIAGPTTTCIGNTAVYSITSNPGNIWQWNAIGGNITAQTPTALTVVWGNINQGQVSIQNTICPKLCTKFVTINAIPTGIITLGDSSCRGDTVRLKGPPGYTYSWSTGATTQTIVVSTTGTYSLWLIQAGCSTLLSYNIGPFPKKPKPNVNITWNCMAAPSLPIPYYMAATQNATWSYQWSPQTSVPSTADTSFQHYSTVFNSTHTVIVTDKNGCKDTASVTLNQSCTVTGGGGGTTCVCSPTVAATYDPCFGQFTLTATGATIGAYYWNFSDGDYSNLQNPQHWFSDTGTYYVTLAVYCTSGCWSTTKVVVYVPYILRPKIRSTFPVTCNYNYIQLSYKPTSVVKGAAVNYSTDWGDGGPLTTGILPKTHVYSLPGTYIIQHTVSYLGCVKTVNDTVRILPFKADFGFCDSGCIGQSIQFVDQSSSWSPIVHWGWNFGDATNSNLQSPFHIYNVVGNYNVQLIIQNQQGCKDTAQYLIHTTTFNPPGLTYAVVNGTQSGTTFSICEGGYVIATAPFSASYTYAWNDGKFGNKDTIRTSGVYWVNVTNKNGCIKKLGPFTVIVNPNPNATILSPDTMCSASYFTLLALNGLGYNWNWTLNPGAFTATGNPAAFSSVPAGNYNAVLTVTNAFGCAAKDTLKLKILQGPVVTVTPPFTQVCEGNVVTLTASIVGPYTSLQWSNGQTINPITVFSTGNYVLTATDLKGCQGQGSGYVIVNPKPDLSNIPKGCYQICKTEIGLAKVCGPFPLSGQVFTYNWTLNGSPYSTNQNITLNSPGTYVLTVTNTVTGCSATSKPFIVTFVTGPVANIGANSPNPTICAGSGACITLTALSPQNNVIYTWWWNNSYLTTGLTAQACNPGTYILHAFRSHCCEAWDTIRIKEGDCCFNPTDTTFHLIQDSTVYTSNTWWDGKYYVAGRVFVRNKAVLDMTTIDVVFDRDGEIIFEDSSVIRANNSVFRPCDMHDVWVGFTFKDSASGFIHTNTFKNAMHAIDVLTSGPEGVKITDNTFTDCNIGVRIDRGSKNYNQGITHNSFVLSNYDFKAKGLYPTYDNFGIILRSVKMEEIVSQNDFRNSDKASQPNRYFGIYALRFSANISENKFTNMYRSIDAISNTGPLNIENNEIEKTYKGKFSSDVQIRLSNSDLPVVVYANELRSSDDVYNRSTGIFAERMNSLNIRDNNVKGFDIGIWTRRTNNAVVNENDIDMAGDIGILDSLSRGMNINCNIIRLKDCRSVKWTSCNSIGIFMQAGNKTNNIFTNCIFDTRRSISLRSDGTNIPIPNVVNNYMYNYLRCGVESNGHVGGIGFAGQPGRNTFVSNNYNNGAGSLDIIATPLASVSEQCNFGIIANSSGVASIPCPPSTMYSSTAACGQQINIQKYYAQNKWDICDNYTGAPLHDIIIIIDHGKDIRLDTQKLKKVDLQGMGTEGMMQIAEVAIYLNNRTAFNAWINRLSSEKALDDFTIDLLKAKWEAMNGDNKNASVLLSGASPNNSKQGDLKTILLADWNRKAGESVDKNTLASLIAIDRANNELSPLARDLVHASIADNDYIFGGLAAPENQGTSPGYEKPFVRVVPNPAADAVQIQFVIPGSQNAEISLHSISGQKISVAILKINGGMYKMDLSKVSPGIYFVTVFDTETNEKFVAKLIKQ